MPDATSAPLILVVDDAPLNGAVTSMLLRQLGYQVMAVDSGQVAIAVVQERPIALVLMDCQMPGMDGYEATARIRQVLAPGRKLPILALSGLDDVQDRQRSLLAGMDDHLAKPLLLDALRAALVRWLPSGQASAISVATPPPAASTARLLDRGALAVFNRMRPGSSAVLLGIFLKDLVATEASLGTACHEGDLASVAKLAHKLKGSALTIGAQVLGEAMKELGIAARSGSLPASQACWQRTLLVLAATREAIDACGPLTPLAALAAPVGSSRASTEVLHRQRSRARRSAGLLACLEAMPGPALLLNGERQIVAANGVCQSLLGQPDESRLVGMRSGEALGCRHVAEGPDGCGTAPACVFCGSMQAIAGGLQQQRTIREARLTIGADTGHALECEITASPILLEDERFVILALRDLADEKRRQVLDQLFFHDVLNSVGGFHGLATQLAQRQVAPVDEDEVHQILARTSQQVIEEIQYQRLLTTAESGQLQVDLVAVPLGPLLREVRDICAGHPVAAQRSLLLEVPEQAVVRTDRVLFRRVLGNLVKNALEATPPGGVVTIACRQLHAMMECAVRNPGEMPLAVRHQLFQRSFTTKGVGRGLGTWSAKLLGERYLGGRLSFTSSREAGTELVFALPLDA